MRHRVLLLAVVLLSAAAAGPLGAETAPPGEAPEQMAMAEPLGIPMAREASGTSWQPDATQVPALHLPVKQGALVERVYKGSPGAQAGLRGSSRPADVLGYQDLKSGGDVIVAIDGKPVRSADDVVRIVSFELRPGAVATFTVVRGGQRKVVAVTLGHRAAG